MHWLAMKLRTVVPATELFSTFRERILQAAPTPNMEVLIPELVRDARTMRSFDHQDAGSTEAVFFERLLALDTSTVIPLVLYLFREPSISPERRRRALRLLESWLVRRMLMLLTAKNYNMQVPIIIGRVAADPEHADDVVLDELRTGVGQVSRWPDDKELRDQLVDRPLYGYIAQARIVMIFRAIEVALYSTKVEAVTPPAKLSIEHVMPQSWDEHWPLSAGLDSAENERAVVERRAHIDRIGNLTVTTMALRCPRCRTRRGRRSRRP